MFSRNYFQQAYEGCKNETYQVLHKSWTPGEFAFVCFSVGG